MFDELLKLVGQMDGMQVTIPAEIPADDDGYVDRECPAEGCKFQFKIHGEDWRDIVRDEEVLCPFCGHVADAESWWTTEQIEHLQSRAFEHVEEMIDGPVHRDVQAFNQKQPRGGFITMTMNVSSGPRELVLPVAAAKPMQLKMTCEKCRCRSAIIGSAFFCPSCGHNSADRVFRQSLGTISAMLDAVPAIRSGIADADTAENTIRLLTESGLQNVVMAFQRFAEALYQRRPGHAPVRRNAFQNISEGSRIWRNTFGRGYDDHLGAGEVAELTLLFQQRHLLAHREGLIDADYIVRSGDPAYRDGQRLVVRDSSVRRALELVGKLSAGMATDL